jgi:hypothetical protein
MEELLTLRQAIENRIQQKKQDIHPSHNRAYIDSLWIEIETLQWVLDQIFNFKQEGFLNHETFLWYSAVLM